MSFLKGSPIDATLAPSASTTQTALPDWYTNYAMQIIANQQQQASTPYTPYQGPRVADFSADQQKAFELARQVARPEGLQKVEGALSSISGRSSVGAADPYFSRASAMSGVDAATPGLTSGAGYLAQSTNPTGIDMASPYLSAASGRSVDDIAQYMDPYQDQVVDRFGDLAARQVREKLLPELTDRFIASGQFDGGAGGGEAPSRFGMELGRGVRDIQADTAAQQAALMSQGWQGALSASSTDLARQGALAQTAGSLGQQQQQILQNAGTGMADIGKTMGALTADQQRILADMGTSRGNLYNQDTQAQLQAAQQAAAVAQQRQDMGIKGAGALAGVGQQQQQLDQANYDVAYADFLRQKGYNQEQIDAAIKTLTGVQPAVPKGTLQEGYAPVANQGTNPSGLQTIAGAVGSVLPYLGGI